MSKYFKYRSLDDLRRDVEERGVGIELAGDVAPLLSPITIAGRTLGNRLAVHPMEGCDGTLEGRPGELTFRRWKRFGAGGAKLIWGEATAVVAEGRANPRQLLISNDTAPDLEKLLNTTRKEHRERFGDDGDLLVGLQLTHSGRWSHPESLIPRRAEPLDAIKATGDVLGDGYLEQLEDHFADAAGLTRDIGFDFVDIKQCHTYLLNELLASRTRYGRYGGDFESRTRFIRNVLRKIRDRVGNDFLLASRVNVYDGPPFAPDDDNIGRPVSDLGYDYGFGTSAGDASTPDLSEPLRLIGMLRRAGVALVNVTMGSPYFNPHISRPFERPPIDGYWPPEHPLVGVQRHFDATATIQEAFPDLTIVGTGYSWLRHYAANAGAANVAAGRVSIMGLGRGALAYPDFAADLKEHGSMSDKKACIGVSYCTALMRAKNNELGQFPAGCVPRDPLYAVEIKKIGLNTDAT